jgi:tetratricopeptide (TPR) repeat protein
MKNAWELIRSIKNWLWQNFNCIIYNPSIFIPCIVTIIYFSYIIFFVFFNNQDIWEHFGLLLGLIALIYAIVCAESSKDQLDKAQEGLNKIQLDYWITRGNDLYKEKKYFDADVSFERAININSEDIRIWINKASSLKAQKKLDDALDAINKAIDIDLNNADAWNIKGVILSGIATQKQKKMDTKLFGRCMDIYKIPFIVENMFSENYVDPDSDSHGTWHNRRDLYLTQSITAINKAIKIRSEEMVHKPSNVLKDWLGNAWSNLGVSLSWLNRNDEAIEALNKAIEINANNANIWSNKGIVLWSNGKLSDAIQAFDEAIRLDPKHNQSWCIKGLIYLDAAISNEEAISYNDAIRCFTRVIEIDPLDQDTWINRGVALLRKGDNEEAIKSTEKALEINPKNHYAWLNLSICFLGLSRFEKALESVNKALELYNIDSLNWHNIYKYYINNRNYIDADYAYNNEFIINIEVSWILTLKGDIMSNLALWNRKRFVDALRAYDEAIEKYKLNTLACHGKFIALYLKGDIHNSKRAYLDAVSFAHLLNQNGPYIDAFEWPRYWRPSSNFPTWTNLYTTLRNQY